MTLAEFTATAKRVPSLHVALPEYEATRPDCAVILYDGEFWIGITGPDAFGEAYFLTTDTNWETPSRNLAELEAQLHDWIEAMMRTPRHDPHSKP